MTDNAPIFPRIEMGRADVAALARSMRTKLTKQRREERAPPRLDERESLDCLLYPVGWNHLGEPVQWELVTMVEHHAAGELCVRGNSERQCVRRARGALLDALAKKRTYPTSEVARARAREAAIRVTTLEKKP